MTRAKMDVVDWNNDGKLDIVSGMEHGNVVVILNVGTKTEPKFAKPYTLKTKQGGKLKCGMRCDITVVDWDLDKKKDIVSADEFGVVRFFKNVGTDAKPAFNMNWQFLKCEGWPIYFCDNVLKNKFDFNNDGKKDWVNMNNLGNVGGYHGPHLHVDGKKYKCEEFGMKARCRINGCDWNNDGFHDLLVGLNSGGVELLINKGIKGKAEYHKPIRLSVNGKKIKVGEKVSPMVLDWDKDGKNDLICIDNTGTGMLFRNIGTKTEPKLAEGKLVQPPKPFRIMYGGRSRLDIFDWNGDGLPDLFFTPSYNRQGKMYVFLRAKK